MATPVKDFALVTVNGTYGAGDTAVTLMTGNGSSLPQTTNGVTYPLVWWNETDYPHAALDPYREIVLITNRSNDTLATIIRGQQGTIASPKNIAGKTYRMSLSLTAAMWESLRVPTQMHQGLRLRTHRDYDKANYQVELVGVDAIIMDDGVELRNDAGEWSGKTADITISGAGGLDTGIEQNGYWYEIYAIAKEDGTRNLLLHYSKQWKVGTNYPVGDDATQGIRSAVDNSTVKVAQGFKVGDSGPAIAVDLRLIKVGSPTGKIYLTIETDSGGLPSGTVLATSRAYDVSRIPTASIWVRFTMMSFPTLSSLTQYHIVVQGNWTISATDYIGWRMDQTSPTFANGSLSTYDSDGGGSWTADATKDLLFSILLETDNNAVVLPSGYTKRCFLGWVFNNGTGNFNPFLQSDRIRRTIGLSDANSLVWSLSGVSELIDVRSFVPPREILKILIGITGTGASGALAAIGDLSASDISSSGTTVGAQAILYSGVTTQTPGQFHEFMIEYAGVMVQGTQSARLLIAGFEW